MSSFTRLLAAHQVRWDPLWAVDRSQLSCFQNARSADVEVAKYATSSNLMMICYIHTVISYLMQSLICRNGGLDVQIEI